MENNVVVESSRCGVSKEGEHVDQSRKGVEYVSGEVSNGKGGSTNVEGQNAEENECIGDRIVREGKVLSYRSSCCRRDPNVNCRVETFGVLCSNFDETRKRWVIEMGFGGLLYLAGLQLPRTLCYWLMTRVDPENEMFMDGKENCHRLNTNQVRWILGIPKGSKAVPSRAIGEKTTKRVSELEERYSKVMSSKQVEVRGGERTVRKGYPITSSMLDRAEGEWKDEDEEEFKHLFLFLALQMILCPTQCPRLPLDLLPAVACALEAANYDWCELVLRKLMRSVTKFQSDFKKQGYATGCGGCTIFLAIYYLDRLNRNPLRWRESPRLKVWSNAEVRKACKEDRQCEGGDFGKKEMLVVAYGKSHPRDAEDTELEEISIQPTITVRECSRTSRRRGAPKCPRMKY